MTRDPRPRRPTVITTAPESLESEFDRRRRRYAVTAVIFVGCFAAGALLHRHTVVAVTLCAIATVALVAAVIGANVRSPRRGSRLEQVRRRQPELPPARDEAGRNRER